MSRANKCFSDRYELVVARNEYVNGNCGNLYSKCNVTNTYGWPIGTWCVGNITDMSYLFTGSSSHGLRVFNEDISMWDTSNVITMHKMFAHSPYNGDLSGWNTSSVTDMSFLFWESAFNGDISLWDTSSVINMQYAFSRSSFNRDLSLWDVSSVAKFDGCFHEGTFNQDISMWNISSARNMNWMFAYSYSNQDLLHNSTFNQDLCAWADKFPYGQAFKIFNNSACTFQETPQEDWRGPFCASNCTIPDYVKDSLSSPTTLSPIPEVSYWMRAFIDVHSFILSDDFFSAVIIGYYKSLCSKEFKHCTKVSSHLLLWASSLLDILFHLFLELQYLEQSTCPVNRYQRGGKAKLKQGGTIQGWYLAWKRSVRISSLNELLQSIGDMYFNRLLPPLLRHHLENLWPMSLMIVDTISYKNGRTTRHDLASNEERQAFIASLAEGDKLRDAESSSWRSCSISTCWAEPWFLCHWFR